jgi:hypothetical protein
LDAFFELMLKDAGAPITSINLRFLNAIAQKEGDGLATNPLAVTEGGYGGYSVNGSGVLNYPSVAAGAAATAKLWADDGLMAVMKQGNATTAQFLTALSQSSYEGTGTKGAQKTAAYAQSVGSILGDPNFQGASGSYGAGGAPSSKTTGTASSPPADAVNLASLEQQYNWDAAFLSAHDDVADMVEQAVAGGWSPDKFVAELKTTNWWRTNSDTAKKWLSLQSSDPAEYTAAVRQKAADIYAAAGSMGATLSVAAAEKLAVNSLVGGWDTAQLNAQLGKYINFTKGGGLQGSSAAVQASLKQLALANGLNIGNGYILSAAQHIAEGTQTLDSYAAQLHEMAASAYPQYQKQILAGQNVSDIMAPYIQAQASLLETNPSSITVQDKLIQQALTNKDPSTGQPTTMPLWQFQDMVRKTPQWQTTDNARESSMTAAHNVLQQFGVVS